MNSPLREGFMRIADDFRTFVAVSIILMLVLTAGLYLNVQILVLLSFVIALAGMLLLQKRHLLHFIVFLMPISNVFKYSHDSFSLYTFTNLFALGLLLTIYMKETKFEGRQMLLIVMLCGYSIAHFYDHSFNYFEFLGFFSNLVLVAIFTCRGNELMDRSKLAIAYILGVFFATLSGILVQDLPHMLVYRRVDTFYIDSVSMSRFVGLSPDPNFYSMQVCIALCLILSIFDRVKQRKLFMLIFVVLSIYGFLSLSKTYLAAYVFMMLWWFFTRGPAQQLKALLVLFVGSSFALLANTQFVFMDKVIHFYKLRMDNFGGSDGLASLTTGRSDIWGVYFEKLSDPLLLLFGTGIDRAFRTVSPHNTYLSLLYSFGIVGSILFIIYLVIIFKSMAGRSVRTRKRSAIRYLPMLIILVFITTIDLLFEDYFMFMLLLGMLELGVDEARIVNDRGSEGADDDESVA